MSVIDPPQHPPYTRRESELQVEWTFSPQLRVIYTRRHRAMWVRWKPSPRACFNPELLEGLVSYDRLLQELNGHLDADHEIVASILVSDVPGVFNLGGDLNLFRVLIEARDRASLLKYGLACTQAIQRNYLAYDQPILTISLVQGECLGGGFEAAMSSDYIVAEKRARFGLPEILFNLFPGMGAYSFVDRRAGPRIADQIMQSGEIYTAEQMHAWGLVDFLAEDGRGEAECQRILEQANARRGIAAMRRRACGVTRKELDDIVEVWVEAALRLTPRDLRLMAMLVSRQTKRSPGNHNLP
jgi:DSF synthase